MAHLQLTGCTHDGSRPHQLVNTQLDDVDKTGCLQNVVAARVVNLSLVLTHRQRLQSTYESVHMTGFIRKHTVIPTTSSF